MLCMFDVWRILQTTVQLKATRGEAQWNSEQWERKLKKIDSCHRMVGLTIMPLLGRWTSWLMRSRSSRVETILTGQMYCTRAMWRCRALCTSLLPTMLFQQTVHVGPCGVATIAFAQKGKKRETRTDTHSLAASLAMPGCKSCGTPSRHSVLGELVASSPGSSHF